MADDPRDTRSRPEFDDRDPTRTLRYPLSDLELALALTQVEITLLSEFGHPICEVEIYECGYFQWRPVVRDAMLRKVTENPFREAVFDVRPVPLGVMLNRCVEVQRG